MKLGTYKLSAIIANNHVWYTVTTELNLETLNNACRCRVIQLIHFEIIGIIIDCDKIFLFLKGKKSYPYFTPRTIWYIVSHQRFFLLVIFELVTRAALTNGIFYLVLHV